jgi:hypothetical protein
MVDGFNRQALIAGISPALKASRGVAIMTK